jgi:hypothetical protein
MEILGGASSSTAGDVGGRAEDLGVIFGMSFRAKFGLNAFDNEGASFV